MRNQILYVLILILLFVLSCNTKQKNEKKIESDISGSVLSKDILNYIGTPKDSDDKNMLMFSDQGAWFAYSLPDKISSFAGFSGPFLLTQENGIWSSNILSKMALLGVNGEKIIWNQYQKASFISHLEQILNNKNLHLKQQLLFISGHTAGIQSVLTNKTLHDVDISFQWKNTKILASGLSLSNENNEIIITSTKSSAIGHLLFPDNTNISVTDSSYVVQLENIKLKPGETKSFLTSQSFIFPEYSWEKEKLFIKKINFNQALTQNINKKNKQLSYLFSNLKEQFSTKKYKQLLIKSVLTMQNNWRMAAGELKHGGLFPSYHYKWFNGFWSWDSWKHAAGLLYDTHLAKDQIRAMFDYQQEDGFIVDCIFRDTLIEKHNFRDTKPPLSAWAVERIYQTDKDVDFLKEIYPKLKKYHEWWYKKRDHDNDGLCEYGSTDGSLIAAKWESGMDNAIRFDQSIILKNKEGAYSLNQESVDLNAYLYAEKKYLAFLAGVLGNLKDKNRFINEAIELKLKIQQQFYDPSEGWFSDTDLEGKKFIKGEGSEGWIPLWAGVATQDQAEQIMNKMMDPKKFFTKVPFQTMSADHLKFDPLKGYWRGPNWIDQAYFGVEGLRNYGFNKEADLATYQILKGGEGILRKGTSIRENYHPLTGKGLNAKNFSWSAAHIIMLLTEKSNGLQ